MKKLFAILLFLQSLSAAAQKTDSLSIPDSNELRDRIRANANAAITSDSIAITIWADSLQGKILSKFNADSLRLRLKNDSVLSSGYSSNDIKRRLDSLVQTKNGLLAEVEEKKNSLMSTSKEKINTWRETWKAKVTIDPPNDFLTHDTNSVSEKIIGADATLPKAQDLSLINNLQELPHLDGMGGELKLPSTDLMNLELSPDLESLSGKLDLKPLDQLEIVSEKLADIKEQVAPLQEISSNPGGVVDAAAEHISEIAPIKETLGNADALNNSEFAEAAEMLKDPDALKENAKDLVVKEAVNHFEGKEQVLQQAMQQLARYKQKYGSLNSLSEIKKRLPNPMKDKPLIERIIPGVSLQILKNQNLLVDVNPYVGYHFTGRFTSGMGWNQRIGYSLDNNYFTSPSVIYGPRLFGEFKAWRGFILRAEGELMNSVVPPSTRRLTVDDGHREWVRTAFLGIKKEYRFIGKVKGTAHLMFMVYNDHRKSPYGDVVNSRFGFEFPMKARQKN